MNNIELIKEILEDEIRGDVESALKKMLTSVTLPEWKSTGNFNLNILFLIFANLH